MSGVPAETDHFINWLCTKSDFVTILTGRGWSVPIAALGCRQSTNEFAGNNLERLQQLCSANNDWILGHLGYNLKAETERLNSTFPNEDGFTDLFFFVPEIVIYKSGEQWIVGAFDEADLQKTEQYATEFTNSVFTASPPVRLSARQSAEDYISHCKALMKNIHRGDIYEVNYCIDFTGHNRTANPLSIFQDLSSRSDAPFSALYRNQESWLLCASPERFLSKQGSTLISQPIKGTRRRDANPVVDDELKSELQDDEKERSENVMIVDLVRNDLSKVAVRGSVRVPELFGIHSFKTVHQMISTVTCELRPGITISEILRATFPMGSMTGAPKISAMKLAEAHEQQSRGIYSGSVGCITPNGDFDFNVVIRSITWNARSGHLSAKAGSAITAKSDPVKEYEECLLKAQAMMNALKTV